MTTGGIKITVQPGQVAERLQLAADVIGKTPVKATNAAKDVLRARVMARFGTKTGPDGTPWAAWRPRTLAQRTKQGGIERKKGPISLLEFSGYLKKSFYVRVVGGQLQAGFTAPYAGVLENGRNDMEARPMLTNGKGEMAQSDATAVGIAVRTVVAKLLDQYLNK